MQVLSYELSYDCKSHTVQLSPNPHLSQVCPAYVLDVSRIWQKGVRQLRKSCCSFIVRFCNCMDVDVSRLHLRCILHMLLIHVNVTLELSCTIVLFGKNKGFYVRVC